MTVGNPTKMILNFTIPLFIGNALDIIHTIVPKNLEGRGIAATLVETAYKYAKEQGLRPLATCSYAVVWLKRHPEF